MARMSNHIETLLDGSKACHSGVQWIDCLPVVRRIDYDIRPNTSRLCEKPWEVSIEANSPNNFPNQISLRVTGCANNNSLALFSLVKLSVPITNATSGTMYSTKLSKLAEVRVKP